MTLTNQQYRDIYKKLTPEKRGVIASPELSDLIDGIAEVNQLDQDKRNVLAFVIKDLMYEVLDKNNAIQRIKESISVNDDDAKRLLEEVDSKILKNIGILYKQIQDTLDKEGEKEVKLEMDKKSREVVLEKQKVFTMDKKPQIVIWGEKIPANVTLIDKVGKLDIAKKTKGSLEIKDRNSAPDYLKKLPQNIQDLVFDGAWKVRTEEISRKYSLDLTQTDTLINNVLFVIIGLDKPEDFLKLMTSELGISKILADQINEDLEIRVFEYLVKTIETKERKERQGEEAIKVVPKPVEQKVNMPVIEKSITPEVRPINLPAIEKGEMAHDVPHKENPPTISSAPKMATPTVTSTSSPITKPSEAIQKPISVPRFTAVKMDEDLSKEEEVVKPINPENAQPKIEANKEVSEKKPDLPNAPTKQYAVDPYREPME